MTKDKASEIAKGLTAAQRTALLGGNTPGSTKPGLVTMGLMELRPREQTWRAKQQRFDYCLTPLGLEIRRILQSENTQ